MKLRLWLIAITVFYSGVFGSDYFAEQRLARAIRTAVGEEVREALREAFTNFDSFGVGRGYAIQNIGHHIERKGLGSSQTSTSQLEAAALEGVRLAQSELQPLIDSKKEEIELLQFTILQLKTENETLKAALGKKHEE